MEPSMEVDASKPFFPVFSILLQFYLNELPGQGAFQTPFLSTAICWLERTPQVRVLREECDEL